MRNTWLVIKHEVVTTFRKRSFWIMTFLMPAVMIGLNGYYIAQESNLVEAAEEETNEPPAFVQVGLVDDSGIIKEFPAAIPEGIFTVFDDGELALEALESGQVEQYVHVPADYLSSGEVTVYDQEFQILEGGSEGGVGFRGTQSWMLTYLIFYNLSGDEHLTHTLMNPTPGDKANYNQLQPPEETVDAQRRGLGMLLSKIIPFLYYFILILTASYMLQSVAAEKENRTVEVLMLSLRPTELMAGKLAGLSVVVLVQVLIWYGGGMLIMEGGFGWLDFSGFTFPPGFVLWSVLFLLAGYTLYASVMGAVGAVANSAREGNQTTWILILPLMPTLMFSDLFFEEPHGTFSVVMSMFPFSAPSAMITRMAVAEVPVWQVATSLLLLLVTAYLMISLAGRFFRPNNLLSTAEFKWNRFLRAWR